MIKIPLKGKKGKGKYAIIDDSDYDLVKDYTWWDHGCGYAYTKIKGKNVLLHRFLLNTPKNLCTDHINGNGLDNRKSNIRICTKSENCTYKGKQKNNKSGYKGVVFTPLSKINPWVVYFHYNKKNINGGCFPTKELAALKYNELANKYLNKFAYLNKLKST
jgi:hypothetical protein